MSVPALKHGTKLWIEPAQKDESISSVIDRAGALYRMGRGDITAILAVRASCELPEAPLIDWDDPPSSALQLLAAALDSDVASLDQLRIPRGPGWLMPAERRIYCPMCFSDDMASGRTVYFRRSWSRVTSTFCRVHQVPLFSMKSHPNWDGRRIPAALVPSLNDASVSAEKDRQAVTNDANLCRSLVAGSSWSGVDLVQRLLAWEKQLEAMVEEGGDPDTTGDARLKLVRDLLLALGVNQGPYADRPPAGQLRPTAGGWNLSFTSGPDLPAVPSNPSWTAFQSVLSPTYRRAAIFMTAASMETGWPVQDVLGTDIYLESGSAEWWHWVVRRAAGVFLSDELESIRERLGIPAEVPRWHSRIDRLAQ